MYLSCVQIKCKPAKRENTIKKKMCEKLGSAVDKWTDSKGAGSSLTRPYLFSFGQIRCGDGGGQPTGKGEEFAGIGKPALARLHTVEPVERH